jgi:tetratricopeptide (TPR) repeat protein
MSQLSRLDQLLQFLADDPNDPFTLYAIATEYLKSDPLVALSYYEKLLTDHPAYVGTYYHAAKLYLQLGKQQKAEQTYIKGLEVSQVAGNRQAHRELKAAYQEYLDEEE